MSETRNRLKIDERDDGRRVDNYLLRVIKGLPRAHLYKLLRSGQIRVNGSRAKPERRLSAGDEVRVPPALVQPASGETTAPPIGERVKSQVERAIIFEDPHMLVVNKPSGMAVHSGSGLSWGLIDVLRTLYPAPQMVELVHRLDRETSGLIVIARDNATLTALGQAFRTHQVSKSYLALVRGSWQGGRRLLSNRLLAREDNAGRKVRADEEGKDAEAWFTPRQRFANATLMEVALLTGRTHQIRVQAEHAGHPLAGDGRYGDEGFNRQLRALGLNRLFLHSAKLAFTLEGEKYSFDAPLPPMLAELLTALEARNNSHAHGA